MVSLEIASYRVYLMSQKIKRLATIHLQFKGADGMAFLYFHEEPQLPPNKKSGKNFKSFWKIGQFAKVVDILRNEKPVFFYFDEKTNVANVQTTEEPIGEAEGK